MRYLKSFELINEKREKISEVDLGRLIKDISKEYDVKIRIRSENFFKKRKQFGSGFYVGGTNIIYILDTLTLEPSEMLRALFHEIGHVHCYRNNIFKNYHKSIKSVSPEEKKLVRQTGLRAERFVDRWAAKELKKWNPYLKYDFIYSDPEAEKWYKKYYLSLFK